MRHFQRGETIILRGTVRTEAGDLTDPATSIKITVTDPDGTEVVDDQDMDPVSTGIFTYDYTPGASAVLGWYQVRITTVDSSRTTIEDGGFDLHG